MYKYFCALLILISNLPIELQSQNKSKIFKLNGEINANSGIVILMPVGEEIYYPNQMDSYETKVLNKQFTISGSCLYPYAFRIGLKINSEWAYISDVFLVDPGSQKIICNVDSSRVAPTLNNVTMHELIDNSSGSFKTIEQNNKGLEIDSLILKYTIANPNSFVSLWKLIDKFSDNGYQSIYDSIYVHFSTTIKNSYTGNILEKKLKAARIVKIGNVFPCLNLSDSKNLKVLSLSDRQFKFTLIDFWNSHCGPCIGQFDTLKKLYSIYYEKGFSIIGISNDNMKAINNWKGIIKKHQLPWEQFLDLNNIVCSNLSIYKFPSNFLLNEADEIIAKDISTKDLSTFLEINLR